MKNIQIDDPCKEDFSKMTTTQRGHFCGKCKIDVFDFTNKSNEEIKLILRNNIGQHVCGRIEKGTLQDLNSEFQIWQHQNKRSFQSKFMFALIMVFGLSLFSCNEKEAVALGNLSAQSFLPNYKDMGDKEEISLIEQKAYKLDQQIDYIFEERLQQIEEKQNELIDYVGCESIITQEYYDNVAGGMRWDPSYENYLIETVETEEVKELIEIESIIEETTIASFIDAKTFPNPTSGNASLVLNVNIFGQFDIELYSMSGQKVFDIYSGDLDEGRQEFQLDLSDFQNGTYLIVINSENQIETLKLQKLQ